jgi:hypothetical protein
MNDQFESKIINLCVGKLHNSPAIACTSRLDLDYFTSQLVSPSYNQRPLKLYPGTFYCFGAKSFLDQII